MNRLEKLTVIIPTYRRLQVLLTLIEKIKNAEVTGFVLELLVVDDSRDKAVNEAIRQIDGIHCITGSGSWWWTRCVNEGIRHAIDVLRTDYILLLNDDSIIEADYLQKIFRRISQNSNCLLGSVTVTLEKPARITFLGVRGLSPVLKNNIRYLPPFTPLTSLPLEYRDTKLETWKMNGRGMVFHSSLIDAIGLLDEKLVQYGSDDDFAMRAREAGLGVFVCTECIVYDNTFLTAKGAAFRQDNPVDFFRSFLIRYSVNSVHKTYYFYRKRYGFARTLLITLFSIAGAFKAYFINYRKITK